MKHLIIFTFIALLISCNPDGIERDIVDGVLVIKNPENGIWQNKSTPPLSFELEATFGKENEPEEEMLVSIGRVFTDYNANVYIFDRRENHLIKFDSQGNFTWLKGREGKGPGEFNRVRGIVYDSNEIIYVCNSSGSQIDRFNLDGEYLSTNKLSKFNINWATLHAYIDPNMLVVSTSNDSVYGMVGIIVEIIDDKLQLKTKFNFDDGLVVDYPIWLGPDEGVSVSSGIICIASTHEYEFSYFNKEGSHIKKVTRDFNKLVRPIIKTGDNSMSAMTFSSLSAPIRLSDKYELSYSSWPVNLNDPDAYFKNSGSGSNQELKYSSALDLFNTEGDLLYSLKSDSYAPEIGRPVHVDIDGRLYTASDDPYPQVRRYKVIIDD